MKPSARRSYSIGPVQRCLQVLRLFGQATSGLMPAEVAKLSALPTSTVYRFLANLETAGFLTCSDSGKYFVDSACFSAGRVAQSHLDIRRVSLPYLKALNEHTRETIHLLVRQGLSAVYVEKLESPQLPNTISRIGVSVALHCTAVGKVLLAYLPPEDLARVLHQIEPRSRTARTISSTEELERHLDHVRRCGYSFDLEENELHMRCVAAPIWDASGNVNASLSVSGPVSRMSMTRMKELAPVIQEAGVRISRELGYQGSVDPEVDWKICGSDPAHRPSQKAALDGRFGNSTKMMWQRRRAEAVPVTRSS
jgi:IclR family KDG regulon transcriptional repressor